MRDTNTNLLWFIRKTDGIMGDRGGAFGSDTIIQLRHLETGKLITIDSEGNFGLTNEYISKESHLRSEIFLIDTSLEGCNLYDGCHIQFGNESGHHWMTVARQETVDGIDVLPVPLETVRTDVRKLGHGAHTWCLKRLEPEKKEVLLKVQNVIATLETLTNRLKDIPSVSQASVDALAKERDAGTLLHMDDEQKGALVRSDPALEFLINNAKAMALPFEEMVLACCTSPDRDPFRCEGVPNTEYQEMCGQQKAIEKTLALLRTVLVNEDPACQEHSLNIPSWVLSSRMAPLGKDLFEMMLLAFRFLRMVIRGNSKMKDQLAEHRTFLTDHLGGTFKANDT